MVNMYVWINVINNFSVVIKILNVIVINFMELLIRGFIFVVIKMMDIKLRIVVWLVIILVNKWIINVNGFVKILKILIIGIIGNGVFNY